jgi:hypothetical protein
MDEFLSWKMIGMPKVQALLKTKNFGMKTLFSLFLDPVFIIQGVQ